MAKRARQSCNLISGTVQGYYAGADGSINSTDTHWCRSELISCKGSTSYVCTVTIAKTSRWVAASFYDIDMNYLGSVDTKPDPPIANVTLSFTTPATAAYMGLSFAATYYYTTLTPSEITNLMLNEGSTALPYEPYGIVGFYEPCAVKKSEIVINLYDKTATNPDNGYSGTSEMQYLAANGSIVPYNYALFIITEYIPINPNASYTLHGNFSNAAASAWCLYDSSKNYIKGEVINRRPEMLIETTSDTAYIRFSPNAVNDGLTSIVLNEGATPLTPGTTIWESCAVKRYGKSENLYDDSQGVNWSSLSVGLSNQLIAVSEPTNFYVSPTSELFVAIVFFSGSTRLGVSAWVSTADTKITTPQGCDGIRLTFRNHAYNVVTEEQKTTTAEAKLYTIGWHDVEE